jgi:hypothetical protein
LFLFDGDGETGELLSSRRLPLGILRVGFGLLDRRLVEADGNLVVGRVDDQKQVALMHELIVLDRQLDDLPGDLRRHGHDIDAHRTVARPGCPHIGVPHSPAEHDSDRDSRQSYQQRGKTQTPAGCNLRDRLGGPRYYDTVLLSFPPRSGFDINHRDLNAQRLRARLWRA